MAVALNWTSDMSKVAKDLDMAQRKIVTLEEKLRGVTKESKNNGNAFKSTFESGLGQIKGMVTGYLSLQGAISLVNSGLAEQKRISQEIHRVQMTAADAQAEVVKNLGNVPTEQATKFLKEIEDIAQKGGAPSVAPVYEAAAQTLSAVGDETLTKSILQETLPFFKAKMSELPTFAGAVGDLANISGAKSPEEIRRVVGLVLSSQKFSRGATLESFKNVAPAVAAVSAVDTSGDKIRAERQGLALSSAISTALVDPDMALTKTATAEVATALAELLPEKDVLDAEGNVKRQGTGMTNLLQRLSAVQASPDLQRRFFETGEGMQAASFRGPIKPVIQSLVSDPSSPIAKMFGTAMTGISDDPAIVGQMRANLIGATPQLGLSESTGRASSVIEEMQLSSLAGNKALAGDALKRGLDQTGGFFGSAIGNYLQMGRFEGMVSKGIDPLTAASDILKGRREDIVNPYGQRNAPILTGMTDEQWEAQNRSRLSKKDADMAEQLDRLIRVLERQQESMEKMQQSTIGGTAAAARDLQLNREGR